MTAGLKKVLLFVLVCFIPALPVTVSAQDPPFEEAYIQLSLGKYTGNAFYRVFVDENETPYIDVQELLYTYLDFTDVQCDNQRLYCSGVLQPDRTVFWIDGKNGEFGSSQSDSKTFDKKATVFIEDKLWVRYDIFQEWLPITASWNLEGYKVHFEPKFKFKFERKKELEKLREDQLENKRQKEYFDSVTPITPTENFNTALKYRAGFVKEPKGDYKASLEYNINSDVYEGTLVGGNAMDFPFKTRRNFYDPYVTYTLKDKKYFYLMEFGTTSFQEQSLLVPSVSSDYGFRFDSDKMEYAEGNITILESAPIGTEVDLYVDGAYRATTTVGPNGQYSFPDVVVSKESKINLKLYYVDGSSEEKSINITRNSGMVKQGHWEKRIYAGNVRDADGGFYYGSLRYGILDNLSFGLSPFMFPEADEPSLMTDMNFAPFYWLSFLAQGMFNGFDGWNIDRAFRANINLLYPHNIQFEHKYYNQDSPMNTNSLSVQEGEYWAGRHRFAIGRWAMTNVYEQYSTIKSFTNETRFNLMRLINLIFGFRTYWSGGSFYRDINTGFNLSLGRETRMEVNRVWSNNVSQNVISLTSRGGENVGSWSVSARFFFDDNWDKDFSTSVLYRLTKNLQIGALSSDKYVGFQIFWDDIIAGSHGPNSWEEFGTGTASGKIMSPDLGDGKQEPIEFASVSIGGKKAVTDKDGYYKVTGIRPEEKIKASIDLASLDTSMIPDKDYDVLYFRRGSYIEWSPILVPTIGMDGYVLTSQDIPDGLMIEAMRLSDSKIVSRSEVDQDEGFFTLEKLTPGQYQLSLNTTELSARPIITVDIPKNADWISGVEWDLEGQNIEGVYVTPQEVQPTTQEFNVYESEPDKKDTLQQELDAVYNITQIKLHSATLSSDAGAEERVGYYKKLLVVIDGIEQLWSVLSEQEKRNNIERIKKVLNSPKMMQDEIDADLMRNLKKELQQRMSKVKGKSSSAAIKKMEAYERIRKVTEALEGTWDKMGLEARAKKLDQIKKALKAVDKL